MSTLIFGISSVNSLELSYYRAIVGLGEECYIFDYRVELNKCVKFGIIGRILSKYLNIPPWVRQMNKKFISVVSNRRPNVIMIFTNSEISIGTILTINSIVSGVKWIWIWPDTPVHIDSEKLWNLSAINFFGCYSKANTNSMANMGFRNVMYLPLAFDNLINQGDLSIVNSYDRDIAFVGTWRPDREQILDFLIEHFASYKIEIHGPGWKRKCGSKRVKKRVVSSGINITEMGDFFRKTKCNINIIDPTNFPAANMRFFEINGSGAIQICSECPEFDQIFRDGSSCFYFKDLKSLKDAVIRVLENVGDLDDIKQKSRELTLNYHTYTERVKSIGIYNL
jgi:hypothetical protein